MADEGLVDIRTVRTVNYLSEFAYTTPLIQRLPAWARPNIVPIYERIFESLKNGKSENLGTVYILETKDENGIEVRLIYEGQQRTLFVIGNYIVTLYNMDTKTPEYKRIKKMIFKDKDLVNNIKSERNVFYIDERLSVNQLFTHLLDGLNRREKGEELTLEKVIETFDFPGYSTFKDAYTERVKDLLLIIETTLKEFLEKEKVSFEIFSNYMLTGVVFEYRKFIDKKAAEQAFINLNTLGESLLESEIRKEQIFSRPEYINNRKALLMYHRLEGKYNNGINSDPIGDVESLTKGYLYAKFVGVSHIKNGNTRRVKEKEMLQRVYDKLFSEGKCPIEEMFTFEQKMSEIVDFSREKNKYSKKIKNIGTVLEHGVTNKWKPVMASFVLRFPNTYLEHLEDFLEVFLDLIAYIVIFKGDNASMVDDKCAYLVNTSTRFEGTAEEYIQTLREQYDNLAKKEDLKRLLAYPKEKPAKILVFALLLLEYLNGTDLYEIYKDKWGIRLNKCTYIKYPQESKNVDEVKKTYQWGTRVKENILKSYRFRIGTYFMGNKEVANTSKYNSVREDNVNAFDELKFKSYEAFATYMPWNLKSLFEGRNKISNAFLSEHCERVENVLVEHFEKKRG